ncbi:phosphate acyltransferase PlsX [Gilvimarinus sp. SDUM040013]|uniref:Phosphate acyltransferase n=1 Tax=Gilvimarinus gilvus TaxID=3058038 RepID=A0ABU4RWU8_9GAMM|nr:phosphate acyltransferase PlsX [Gilvimarinus sp. SDUM040013]MDO3385722.1 phosphate acyltransferase PlsX [Gilvimarinus sp. SDUM040013]MDX6849361.1 phosphate acyltransferase PlsX [Gilvimarinus sp. SDUM040013]
MAESIRLALDAMSGDFGPRITIPAALAFAEAFPNAHLQLYGKADAISEYLPAKPPINVSVVDCEGVIAMDTAPKLALRNGNGSSMAEALKAVAEKRAQACVSAGNSGALMLLAKRHLGMLDGVAWPAFCKSMPVERGATVMLDLGGNIQSSVAQLIQFARMGSVLAMDNSGAQPKVALLNIGTESGKGTALIRECADQLEQLDDINYVGFIEADDIFSGKVAVIVCDGFNGNVALKASEGVARLIARRIEESFSRWPGKLAGLIIWPILRHWRRELNPDAYNGATLVGLNSTVIKSHGAAGVEATCHALKLALDQASYDAPEKIRCALRQ